MDINSGKLERYLDDETIPSVMTRVPDSLKNEADRQLGDNKSVMVNMTEKNNPLVKWAKTEKKKVKKKIVKESRKKNRGK